jgi:hypothetical protein
VGSTWYEAAKEPQVWKLLCKRFLRGIVVDPQVEVTDWKAFFFSKVFWGWDEVGADPLAVLQNNNRIFAISKRRSPTPGESYAGIKGGVCWDSGRHFWQIKIGGTSPEWSELGVVNDQVEGELNDCFKEGMFVMANDNQYYPRESISWCKDNGFETGDIVGLVLDLDEWWICWVVNGRKRLSMNDLPKGKYFPFALVCNPTTTFEVIGYFPFTIIIEDYSL